MFSYIRALLLLMMLLYLAIIYESIPLALLGFTWAVLLVCSFFYLLAAVMRTEGEITVPIGVAERGRDFFVQTVVTNRMMFPPVKMRALIQFGERSARWKKQRPFVVRRKKNAFREDCRVAIAAPGSYVFTLKTLRIYDLTGWFYLVKKCREQARVLVLPEPEAIPVELGERVRSFFGDADTFDELRPGYDPGEMFDVRKFRDGDRLQNVHWKLSAKSDDLIVKENSLPKACPVVCFFAPGQADRGRRLTRIASVTYSLMDAGCPHFAAWHSTGQQDILRIRVDDEESYYRFLTTFLQDAEPETPEKLKEEYQRKYRGESWLHEITVSQEAVPVVDGAAVMKAAGGEPELILR